jgi:hypothetical protein
VSPNGGTVVSPRLVPGSLGAQDLASNILADPLHYGLSWSANGKVWFALLDRKGDMPTAPLSVGKGSRPNIIKGFANKEYSLIYWREEEALISSKALMFQQAACFATPPKSSKKTSPPKK